MKSTCLLASVFLFGRGVATVVSFAPNTKSYRIKKHQRRFISKQLHPTLNIRGGDLKKKSMSTSISSVLGHAADVISGTLVSGTPLRAVGGLWAIASLVVVPLTFIQTFYSFSVGYGFSVAMMALALLTSFSFAESGVSFSTLTSSTPCILAATTFIYGCRLALYILLREYTVESKRKQMKDFDTKPPLQRMPLALSVSLLYAFMVSPVLFAFRGTVKAGTALDKVQIISTCVAAFGMVLESISDQHKFEAKRKSKEGEDKFIGPTSWSYKLVRHPNYLGEILFWVGLFGSGSVSFQKSIVAWLGGCFGLSGILGVMFGASKSLDTKQQNKYGGQPKYDQWKNTVKFSVIPFVK